MRRGCIVVGAEGTNRGSVLVSERIVVLRVSFRANDQLGSRVAQEEWRPVSPRNFSRPELSRPTSSQSARCLSGCVHRRRPSGHERSSSSSRRRPLRFQRPSEPPKGDRWQSSSFRACSVGSSSVASSVYDLRPTLSASTRTSTRARSGRRPRRLLRRSHPLSHPC